MASPGGAPLRRAACAALLLLAVTAAPGFAQHRARLSADLADHLAAGSQAIDVIVHGDAAEVDALAARYNLAVTRYLKSGAVLRVTAGQLDALQQRRGRRSPVGRHPAPVVDGDDRRERSAPTRCGPAAAARRR